jgi:hypothetical protein
MWKLVNNDRTGVLLEQDGVKVAITPNGNIALDPHGDCTDAKGVVREGKFVGEVSEERMEYFRDGFVVSKEMSEEIDKLLLG